jgi:Flp pilus assembly protein CpaB
MTFTRGRPRPLLSVLAGWPRRLLAGACLLAAVLTQLVSWGQPDPQDVRPATASVLVAARPLGPGQVLRDSDIRAEAWPLDLAPVSALPDARSAVGHRVGSAMARGEPLTTSRLLDTSIAAALSPTQVAVTLTLREPANASVLRAGASIDLYAAADSVLADGQAAISSGVGSGRDARASPEPLISGARVLATASATVADSSAPSPADVPLTVVVAVNGSVVGRLAGQPFDTLIATLRPAQ